MTPPTSTPLTDAQRAVVEANLGLITLVLTKRATPPQDWDDAWQDAIFGLARAAQLFDPARGYAFSTYAVTWIRQSVQRGKGTAEGISYRRTRLGNGGDGHWQPPASLDAEHGDGWTMLELVASTEDPEADACSHVDTGSLLAATLAMCRDDVERAIVGAWAAGRPPLVAGLDRHQLARRAERLLARLRHPSRGLRRDAFGVDSAAA